jgi:uncharacterized membrane protein YeaQ/YmgE (transglycosylase-associated protein family)
MFDLLGWNIGMSALAAILLIVGALIVGGLASLIGQVRMGGEWFVTALGALVGGWLGSEAFAGASTWGPQFEGLFVVPALIGAVVLGGVIDAVTRYATAGTYTGHPRPI